MENRTTVRRPYRAYLIHGFLVLISLLKLKTSVSEIRYLWMAVFGISLIVLVKMVVQRYAIEIVDSKLVLRRDFMPSQELFVNDIERVELVARPFSYSRIIMKDQRKIKFNDNDVNFKDLREVCGQLKIPIN